MIHCNEEEAKDVRHGDLSPNDTSSTPQLQSQYVAEDSSAHGNPGMNRFQTYLSPSILHTTTDSIQESKLPPPIPTLRSPIPSNTFHRVCPLDIPSSAIYLETQAFPSRIHPRHHPNPGAIQVAEGSKRAEQPEAYPETLRKDK